MDAGSIVEPSMKARMPRNIGLLLLVLLAPYSHSPELNPQENVWHYLRQNYLANRVFDTYDHPRRML